MNQQKNFHGLILLDNLCGLSFFPLLIACFRLRPVKVYYFQATNIGLKIGNGFRKLKIISNEPEKIKNLFLNDTHDAAQTILVCEALNICLNNQAKIDQEVNKSLTCFENYFRKTCAMGVSKEWVVWLKNLLLQLNRGRVLAREESLSTHNVVLISKNASLISMLGVGPNFLHGIKVFPQAFENKALLYLWGPVVFCFGQCLSYLFQFLDFSNKGIPDFAQKKPVVGLAATVGLKGFDKNRFDDFFWWRKTKIPPEQIVYMFDRQDYQPTLDRLNDLEKFDVQAIALNQKFLGDTTPIQLKDKNISLIKILRSCIFYSKLSLRGVLANKYNRSIISLISWQIYKSEKLLPLYRDINLKGLSHYHESGLEFINLAAQKNNATRIGFHWSCMNAPNASTTRCHEIFFVWGEHDLNIILNSGSISKNILISGCFLSEFSNKSEHQKGEEAVKSMKNKGVQITLTLLDNSALGPDFYGFFFRWLLDDPRIGLLIKSKGDESWNFFCKYEMRELAQQAIDTGRIFKMDESATPADAASLSDFTVGITSISAITVAALKGARVLYLDFEKYDQGNMKTYGIYHSLGPKRCVFYDFESLREAILEYFNDPESNPHLGDASPVLHKFDPFRDGKASQRIGEYVTWYLENLAKNLTKDEALIAATKNYAQKWGADKVIRKNN